MSSQKSGKFSGLADPARVVAFLRSQHRDARVGVAVESRTGGAVSAEQFRKWDELGARPSFMAFVALIDAYGPDFLAALFPTPPAWLIAAAQAEAAQRLDAEIAALAAKRARLTELLPR